MQRRSYEDTWGAPCLQGGHEGTDLMSPTGAPEFAIADGAITPVSGANEDGWNRLGGYTVMLKAAYDIGPGRKGDLFYYAHMDRKSSVPVGTKVGAGQQIGLVGDTGEEPEVTRANFPPHLHFGWYDASGARTNLESGAMNPCPLLLWLEENGGAVSGGTNAAYCEAPQDASLAPSTDGKHRPDSDSPGTNPDLDAGDGNNPRPGLVLGQAQRRHGYPSEPERENGSDGKDEGPSRFDAQIGAASGGSNDGLGRDDGAGDGGGESPALSVARPVASEKQVSRPSARGCYELAQEWLTTNAENWGPT